MLECPRVGEPESIPCSLVVTRNPQLVFIAKTKCGVEVTEKVKRQCNFEGCLTVNSAETKGGLCLLWKDSKMVTIKSYSQNHIDSEIIWNGGVWRFTGIYGHPESNKKKSEVTSLGLWG